MSVQIIKWIILLFVTGNCLSETCMLDSLVSFLHFNAGDLTEETTHKTLDKKVFIRLFIQSRHNKIQSPAEDPLNKFIPRQAVFTGPDHTDYYIYTLQKIII